MRPKSVKMKKVLFPKSLADKMNALIRNLTTLLNTKEEHITELELKVKKLGKCN